MKCKYLERNIKEKKCSDYYWSYGTKHGCYCRLMEWKRKKGVCPYDKKIFSQKKQKNQRKLTE